MRELRNLFAWVMAAGLLAGCTTATVEAPKKELTEPEMVRLTDPNPFANYGPAMKSSAEFPLTVNWQDEHKAELEKATEPSTLDGILSSDLLMRQLLAKVDTAYTGDPLALIQIAAITQRVMDPACPDAVAKRVRWTWLMLDAVRDSAGNDYRACFFLDQLRWCAQPEHVTAIRQRTRNGSAALAAFGEQVIREVK